MDNYLYPVVLLVGNIHGRHIDSKGCLRRKGLGLGPNHTAVIKQDAGWWIGWIEEVPGVNCQESTREALIKSLRITLQEALDLNRQVARGAAGGNFEEAPIAV